MVELVADCGLRMKILSVYNPFGSVLVIFELVEKC